MSSRPNPDPDPNPNPNPRLRVVCLRGKDLVAMDKPGVLGFMGRRARRESYTIKTLGSVFHIDDKPRLLGFMRREPDVSQDHGFN